ncbi:uncharacterized, partial [Tachysurus ichikawai]
KPTGEPHVGRGVSRSHQPTSTRLRPPVCEVRYALWESLCGTWQAKKSLAVPGWA